MTIQPLKIERKKTRTIQIGNVPVGGLTPIAVQSMTNTYTQDVAATVRQIQGLEKAGCEIIRFPAIIARRFKLPEDYGFWPKAGNAHPVAFLAAYVFFILWHSIFIKL